MNLPNKPKQTKQQVISTADRRLHKLDGNLSEAISNVLTQKGWSRQELARRTGIPHSTLSTIMSEASSSRSWNLSHLMRIAVALGVKISDIILAAEQQDYTAFVLIAVSGTEPQSRARLTKIIGCTAPEGTSSELLSMFYTADMMEAVAPGYVSSYLAGQIGDQIVYETLAEIISGLEDGENFWQKFSSAIAESGNTLTS
jgi:transcriptional regulator with XRE-family HTH domain